MSLHMAGSSAVSLAVQLVFHMSGSFFQPPEKDYMIYWLILLSYSINRLGVRKGGNYFLTLKSVSGMHLFDKG